MNKLLTRYGAKRLLRGIRNERGQTLVEYALIIIVIALLAIAAMKLLGGQVNNMYSNAGSQLANP